MSKKTRCILDIRKHYFALPSIILNSFGIRLRALVEQRGTVENAIAEIGVSRGTLFNWFKRASPPPGPEKVKKLRAWLGDEAEWILNGVSKKFPASDGRIVQITEKLRPIPIVSFAHAGEAATYEQLAAHEQEQMFTASSDPKAIAIIVEGDCMSPKIEPGDRVVLNPSRLPRNGQPCVTKLRNDGVIIRLYHREDAKTIRLISLNPTLYPDTVLKSSEYRWCWPVEELVRKKF